MVRGLQPRELLSNHSRPADVPGSVVGIRTEAVRRGSRAHACQPSSLRMPVQQSSPRNGAVLANHIAILFRDLKKSLQAACCLTCFRLHPPRFCSVATDETCRRVWLFPVPRKFLARWPHQTSRRARRFRGITSWTPTSATSTANLAISDARAPSQLSIWTFATHFADRSTIAQAAPSLIRLGIWTKSI